MGITISKLYKLLLNTRQDIRGLKEQAKAEAKKELVHERVEELYRGKSLAEKIKAILRIF